MEHGPHATIIESHKLCYVFKAFENKESSKCFLFFKYEMQELMALSSRNQKATIQIAKLHPLLLLSFWFRCAGRATPNSSSPLNHKL